MTVKDPLTIFNKLYSGIDGKKISNEARNKLSYWYIGHIYGEITFEGFSKILTSVSPKKGEVFYDLGSGTGKAVIVASLLYDFSKCIGVEIIKQLCDTSKRVLTAYEQICEDKKKYVDFWQQDFHNVDFSNADIIFLNATCFYYEINSSFIRKIENLKKGTRIITNTIRINSSQYSVIDAITARFTWAKEPVVIHIRN